MPWYTDLEQLRAEVDLCRAEGETWTDPWVRIMCDFGAGGVWDRDGAAGHPAEIPITLDLIARLLGWQDLYETFGNSFPDPFTWTTPELHGFAAEGLAIAIEVKRQLPDWTVFYHDESRIPILPDPAERLRRWGAGRFDLARFLDLHRPWFDYEITDAVLRTGRPPEPGPGSTS